MPVEIYANLPQTTVSSGGTTTPAAGTTETWTVSSSLSFPAASNTATPPTQFQVSDPSLASEIIAVTNVSSTTWTVTRGAEGTTPVAHAVGFTVKQVVTAGDCSRLGLDNWLAPSPALRETFSRYLCLAGSGSTALTSGTLYMTAIALAQYTVVSNIAFCVAGTALTGTIQHGWHALLDPGTGSGPVLRAVSADQSPGTWLSVTQTPYSLAMQTPYTVPTTGLYYIGLMVATSGGTGTPSMAVAGTTRGALGSAAPILCGTSSTGQTTPPALGTTMTALSSSVGFSFYGYVS